MPATRLGAAGIGIRSIEREAAGDRPKHIIRQGQILNLNAALGYLFGIANPDLGIHFDGEGPVVFHDIDYAPLIEGQASRSFGSTRCRVGIPQFYLAQDGLWPARRCG